MDQQEVKKHKRSFVGEVVSDKMNKTIVVNVVRDFSDPLYKKVVRTSKKYKTHDADEKAKTGDFVEIYEGRPLSKTKYMYLSRIIRSARK